MFNFIIARKLIGSSDSRLMVATLDGDQVHWGTLEEAEVLRDCVSKEFPQGDYRIIKITLDMYIG